jgi:hypothetical protein
MRALVVLFIWICSVACNGGSGGGCPTENGAFGDTVEGEPCTAPSTTTCFVQSSFSGCASAFYRCVGGAWHLDHGLNANDGESCTDSPIASCSYEGNPSCNTAPTAESCSCNADGTWHCSCFCYGPQTTCGSCPSRPLNGAQCDSTGSSCPYATSTCVCTADTNGSGDSHFVCN